MSTLTAQRIITLVMRDLNYIGRNADPKGNESADALIKLQQVLGVLSKRSLLRPYTLIEPVILTDAVSLYTVGPTGTIVVARPDFINRASVVEGTSPNTVETPLYCAKDEADWQRYVSKTYTSTRPGAIWYNPKTTNGELNVHPVPSDTPLIWLYLQDRYTAPTLLTSQITLDDGELLMLHYQLGLHLQPGLGVPLPNNWINLANQTIADIKSPNIKHGTLSLDGVPGVQSSYDFNADGRVY